MVKISTAAMVSINENPRFLLSRSLNPRIVFIGTSYTNDRAQRNGGRVGEVVIAYRQWLTRRDSYQLGPGSARNLRDTPAHVTDDPAVGTAHCVVGLVSGNRSLAKVNVPCACYCGSTTRTGRNLYVVPSTVCNGERGVALGRCRSYVFQYCLGYVGGSGVHSVAAVACDPKYDHRHSAHNGDG